MEGLREHAKGFILKAMREGQYPKIEEQQRAEIDEFEQQTWMVHGNTYCKAYVEAVNKKCRDMWLTAQQVPWLFVDIERLVDVPLDEAMKHMRNMVLLLAGIQKMQAECTSLRESLGMTIDFAVLRESLRIKFGDLVTHLKQFLEVSYPGLTGQFPGTECKKARDSLANVDDAINDMVKAWTGTGKSAVILSAAEFQTKLGRFNVLCDELMRLKSELDKASIVHQQLRAVHADGIAYVESFAQLRPDYASISIPLPFPERLPNAKYPFPHQKTLPVVSGPATPSSPAPISTPTSVPVPTTVASNPKPKIVFSMPPALARARLTPPTPPSRVRERDAAAADNDTEVAVTQPPAKRATPPKKTK